MKTKVIKTLLTIVFLLCGMEMSAFEVDGIYYDIVSSTEKKCKVTSNRAKYSGDIEIPDKVANNGETWTVTGIGDNAFYRCSGLTCITIPNSVTTIGGSAFEECTGITSITIPNSVTNIGDNTFDGCIALEKLVIEDGTEKLEFGNDIFYDCLLKYLYLGRNLSYNGDSPFHNKSTLTEVNIGNSVTSIGDKAFYGCSGLISIKIPNSVTRIGNNSFEGCTALEKLIIEDGTEKLELGNDILLNCPLKSLYLGKNLSYRYQSPFKNKSKLTEMNIGNSVTSIEDNTFSGCSGLTSIIIPNSVTIIGESAFSGCTALEKLTMEDGQEILKLGNNNYYHGLFSDCPLKFLYLGRTLSYIYHNDYKLSPFSNKSTLTEVTIGNSVITIGDFAFRDCSGLTSIIIPNSVTSIGSSAFSGCSGLTSIIIPNSVTSIGSSAFSGCSGLTSITIPNSVTSIGNYAFEGCSGLTSITIPNSVTSIGMYAFNGCGALEKLIIEDGFKILKLENTQIFSNCPLKSLYLGRNLSFPSAGYSPFFQKNTLIEIEIGNLVTSIEDYTFDRCSGITSVTIGNSVTNIGMWAFYLCTSITTIYSFNPIPPKTSDYSFGYPGNMYNPTLYVLNEAVEKYKTTNPWNNFSKILGFDPTGIQGVEADGNGRRNVYYDLNGRRLSAPRKGLNIINGKKVIIK